MSGRGVLVVLRGSSGSGKSTVARMVQRRFARAECLVISQDRVRRDMLRERYTADGVNGELIEAIALWGLDRQMVVIVEGILSAGRYHRVLLRLGERAAATCFFAWDLDFEETVRRHDQRPQREEFSPEEMADWYHGWDPLDFVAETRIDESITPEQAADLITQRIREVGGGSISW